MEQLTEFASREDLATGVAEHVAAQLKAAIAAREAASLAVAGGSTPAPALERLAHYRGVEWSKVTVTLTDERIAPPEAEVSNGEMVGLHLLQGEAVAAHFRPLDGPEALAGIDLPFDAIILGMGADGHIASIFPDGEGMEAAWAEEAPLVVWTLPLPPPPEAPFPRHTLSFRALRQCRSMILMVAGQTKRDVLEKAMSDGPEADLPVGRLLRAPDLPLRVFWAP